MPGEPAVRDATADVAMQADRRHGLVPKTVLSPRIAPAIQKAKARSTAVAAR